ncbi:hypothetical protein [Natrinema gari]|uniref:Uncharacterized protein n=1 Tax=Natrinema gari JCM 14663 TaxID=1230459 RepID=L9ZH65_9EURY|nr:hypothetical protein [Natrinema gari]ELY85406.1 hypothetical protein C486_00155 [Natrinema gari JCM 14663]
MAADSGISKRDDRFDAHIYDLDLGDDMPDFEAVECTPAAHAGRPAFVFAIGPHDEDVRKTKVCTECGLRMDETAFHDVTAVTLEAVGGVRDRVHNYPGETDLEKVPLADVLELAGIDADAVDVTHTGVTGDELMIQTTDAEGDDE